MNMTQTFRGVIIGALFSGFIFAVCAAFLTINSGSIGELGLKSRDFWWIYTVLGALLGSVTGGLVGGTVLALDLNGIRGGICVFLFLLVPVLFVLLSGDKFDKDIKHLGIAFLAVETLTGIIVPWLAPMLHKSEY